MTIEEILAGESKNVEFKENLPEKSIKYMKSVVAFANGTGGKIIFGIADKSREVVGFDKEEVFKIMDAIRELIVNAMVHRSYLDHGTIQVAVYDNRLEITSPGKLPMGQTMERMKEGYSKIRNEALAHAFANYGVEVLNKEKVQIEKLLQIIEKNPFATQAYYAEQIGVSKRTVSRMFVSLQEKGILIQNGTKRKSNWIIKK